MNKPQQEASPVNTPKSNFFTSQAIGSERMTLALALLILGVSLIGAHLWRQYQSHQQVLQFRERERSRSLTILSVSPFERVNRETFITINFSDPVDKHKVAHSLFISPELPGTVEYGADEKTILYKPSDAFAPGRSYSIRIALGLTSKNNKRLLADYYSNFYTDVQTNLVQFMSEGLSARVLSFSAQKPIELTVQKGTNVGDIKVQVYTSSEDTLLSFLTYKKTVHTENNYSWTSEEYIKTKFEHPAQNLVQTTEIKDAETRLPLSLGPGTYYVKASETDGGEVGSAFIIVNTKGVILRQDDKNVYMVPYDLATGRISNTLDVLLYNMENTPKLLTQRTLTNLQHYALPFDTRLDMVIANAGAEPIFIPLRLPDSQADIQVSSDLDRDVRIFLYTDRPIYKPGDTVQIRGVARVDGDALYSVLPNKQVRVWADDSNKPPIDLTMTTDSHGVFYGQFTITEELGKMSNWHGLYATTNLNQNPNTYPYSQGSASFEIAQYKKPEFEISTDVAEKEQTGSKPISFTVSAKFFDGKPYANQSVEYTVYRREYFETEKAVYNSSFNINAQGGMCGGGGFDEYYGDELEKKSVTLDQNGKATVTYTPPKDKIENSQTVTLVAQKKDSAGNDIVSAASTLVHASAFNLFFLPSANRYAFGEEIIAPLYAESLTGEKIQGKVLSYKLFGDTNSGNTQVEKVYATGEIKTDENGKAIVRIAVPEEFTDRQSDSYLSLAVFGTDDGGNTVRNTKSLWIRNPTTANNYTWWDRFSTTQTYLKIVSSKNSFIVGDTIRLEVISPQAIDALMSLERGRIYEPKIINLSKGTTTVDIPVTAPLSPSITVVFSFFADGAYHTEGLALNVPAMHKLMTVDVKADKSTYQPGESALIKILTRDASGAPIAADLSLGVVDKAIYALRKSATPPMHSSFYYFRPRRTNASSSLTWIGTYGGGGGGGGGGAEGLSKLVDTLYWNPNLRTEASGEVVVSVPLGSTVTTWKAQAYGSTDATELGQGETEFLVAP